MWRCAAFFSYLCSLSLFFWCCSPFLYGSLPTLRHNPKPDYSWYPSRLWNCAKIKDSNAALSLFPSTRLPCLCNRGHSCLWLSDKPVKTKNILSSTALRCRYWLPSLRVVGLYRGCFDRRWAVLLPWDWSRENRNESFYSLWCPLWSEWISRPIHR